MHLMLDEKVDQWDKSTKEGRREVLAIFDSFWIGRAQRNATGGPGYCCNDVRDHKNVMPVVIVGRGNISPAAACQGSEYPHNGNKCGEFLARFPCQEIPKSNEGKPRT